MPSNKVLRKVSQAWTEEDMVAAIDEVKSSTKSIRSIASDNGVAESSLRFRLKRMKAGGNLQKVGKKRVFSDIEEGELANCISVLCNNGCCGHFDVASYRISLNNFK